MSGPVNAHLRLVAGDPAVIGEILPAVSLRGVTKRFGRRAVLDRLRRP